MTDIAGFPPEALAWILAAASIYFVICWTPVLWPLIATHAQRKAFPRRWLFVATVFCLAYGVIVAALFLVSIPIAGYDAFIAPTLSERGFTLTDPFLKANRFVTTFWWLLLPPALLLNTFYIVRKLRPAWASICQALTANNSSKPTPLRGAA